MKLVGFERNFQFFSVFEGFLAVLKMGVAGSALKKNRYVKCAATRAVSRSQEPGVSWQEEGEGEGAGAMRRRRGKQSSGALRAKKNGKTVTDWGRRAS